MELDRNARLNAINDLTQVTSPVSVAQEGKKARIQAINVLAAKPLPPIQVLTYKSKKLQSLFSDKASRMSRHQLMQPLFPEHTIRIYSASVSTSSTICCFPSVKLTVFTTGHSYSGSGHKL